LNVSPAAVPAEIDVILPVESTTTVASVYVPADAPVAFAQEDTVPLVVRYLPELPV
jgi:hypothetical protein